MLVLQGDSGADAGTVASAVTAADEFLASLSDDQRAAAVFEFADLDGKSASWSNFEQSEFDGRQGARFGDLDEDQKAAAMAVLASVLSAGGYEYVQGAMAAEDLLIPGNIDEYYLAFYGEPSTDEPWTLQFGGHHLAIHISLGGDILSVSPYFQGVQPIVLDVDGTTIEPMASDTNNMFGLFESLDDDQLAAARLTRGSAIWSWDRKSTPGTRSRKVCRTPSSPPTSRISCVRQSPTGWPTPPPSWPGRC